MKIIVTDGNTRAALAITRALGQEGNQIIIGSTKIPSLASTSRFCAKSLVYPDPRKESAGFISTLCKIVKEEKPDVFLPVTDITTLLVVENKSDLEKYCAIPFPEYKTVQRAADKYQVMKLAEELGVPIPATIYLHSPEELDTGLPSPSSVLGQPVVVKPARSRIHTGNSWRSSGVKYAYDDHHLKLILQNRGSGTEYPILLQERINGEGVGLFLCMDRGEVVAAFSHRRLREKPPSGGVSVLRESIPVQPALREYSERLLKALNWHGIAMVEFKKDEKTGHYRLMEINGRFWGSLQLAIDSGVNFPSMLVKIAKGEIINPVPDYRVGVKTRWFWGDVDVLLSLLFKRKKSLHLPPDYPGRWRCFLDFMHFREKNLHYEVFNRDDIRPWLFETYSWFFRNPS